MDPEVKEVKVSIALSVEEWQEVIAGLTAQSFNGRECAETLRIRISDIVQDKLNCTKESHGNQHHRERISFH